MRRKRPTRDDPKTAALRARGALHPHPELVQDEAFRRQEFFDARDAVQVKYEMLRRHRVDERPVTEVAQAFGTSRQAFYTAQAVFEAEGMPGLVPKRRGPRHAHKCTDEILDFVDRWRGGEDVQVNEGPGEAVKRRFGITINPRSIDRALARRKKKPKEPERSNP